MTYIRPVRLADLKEFLEQHDSLDALDLAQKLIDRFDILTYALDQS